MISDFFFYVLFTAQSLLRKDCPLHAAGGNCPEAQHRRAASVHPRSQWQGEGRLQRKLLNVRVKRN